MQKQIRKADYQQYEETLQLNYSTVLIYGYFYSSP